MKIMRQTLCSLVIPIALAGCIRGANPKDQALRIPEKKIPRALAPLKQFVWGEGKIIVGMSKPQVLEQIELSWKRPENDPFAGMDIPGIDRIKGAKAESKEWLLSFGPHTGHAPGGGHIRLFFVNNKLDRIEMIPTRAA